MSGKKAFFLSDMHLGAAYYPDSKEREMRVVAFLDSIKEEADEIYLLGDVLDYWYEYKYVVPRGFVRFFGKLAELSDKGIKITWIIGNHDIWIFDYIPSELGVTVVDGSLSTSVFGTQMLMAHGDGVWQHSRKFKILRSLFRNKFCQRLYASVHPRWTVAFANAWSRHSRLSAIGETPDIRERRRSIVKQRAMFHIDHLVKFAEEYSISHPECKFFLFGHVHEVYEKTLPNSSKVIVLGDWIERFTYAVFDGKNMQIKKYDDDALSQPLNTLHNNT